MAFWCKLVIVFLFVGVQCVDNDDTELLQIDHDVDHEKWRAVERQPDNQDWVPSEALPLTLFTEEEEEPVLKRRRPGRKRKRRPQNYERDYQQDEEPYPDRLPSKSRTRRPQRLDQRHDQWRDEMMAEEPFRPVRNYNRRRQYPRYEDDSPRDSPSTSEDANNEEIQFRPSSTIQMSDDTPQKTETIIEKIRDPYTALNEDQNKRRNSKRRYPNRTPEPETVTESDVIQTTEASNSPDLKTLLKQTGGISLSELLQQKNLSLADLLKGEQHAISALSAIPEQTSEPYKHDSRFAQDTTEDKSRRYGSYRRIPSNRKYARQDENHNDEFTSSKENLESQRRRLPTLNENRESKLFTESLSEPTTERRIFVPSHPKFYTSVDFKPNIKEIDIEKTTPSFSSIGTTTEELETTSESISIVSSTVSFSTSSESPTFNRSKLLLKTQSNNLPPTLAKLKTLSVKTTAKSITKDATENYPKSLPVPLKAFKINISELFSVLNTTVTEGPMKISVNLDHMVDKPQEETPREEPKLITIIVENKTKSTANESKEINNVKPLSAQDEIQEILSDNVSRENLTKILESRNMTLEELVQLRERGSSQRHLADIFHNQTKEPEPPEEMVVDEIVKPNVQNENYFPIFKTFKHESNVPLQPVVDFDYNSPKTRESRQNQLPGNENDDYNFINNPLFRNRSDDLVSKYMPVWRQAYTDLNNKNNQRGVLTNRIKEDELIIKDEAQRIEEIENKLAEAVNEVLNVDIINHKTYINEENDDVSEFMRLPYGVRSAIIASAIIIGISMLVFLTIFIIFKWTQRQRKHLAYSNSFSSSKIRTPILDTPYQKRMFTAIMNATLGRKKAVPTISSNQPQSLQEYLWENNRKSFQ